METNTQEPEKKEPSLDDIGTRFEHLSDYADALEACADILEKKGLKNQNDQQRYIKFRVAYEVIRTTIDSFSGYSDSRVEYQLYKMLHSIPSEANKIEGGRGTELKHDPNLGFNKN